MEIDSRAGAGASCRDLVVIGASAGGIETLRTVVSGLPRDLTASVCIVVHIAPSSPSALASILSRAGPLQCRQAVDGEPLKPGEIIVAPPDRHLVIDAGRARLTVGPRENGHRPAVDMLFRSAAAARDGRVIGVILSGNRDDGAAGLAAIKAGGGGTIVQDPEEALYAGMPANALANVDVDAVVRSDQVAGAIAAMLVDEDPTPPDDDGAAQADPSEDPAVAGTSNPESPSSTRAHVFSCPECGGVLIEQREAGVPQWRCQVGHRYSAESFANEQARSVETALWSAIRALEERGALLERMAQQCDARGQRRSARSFRHKATDAHEQAEIVRTALHAAAHRSLGEVTIGESRESIEEDPAA